MMLVTFYSYKGGVGRSMALANVACLLAEDRVHPQRVLLWDFDLEAPGLHKLFPPLEPFRRGFVDLAFEFAQTHKLPDPNDFVYQSVVSGVDVLPAGHVDQEYCNRLEQLNWTGFFGDDPTDLGEFFGPLTSWMGADSNGLLKRYDYILIDSRTGLNDVAGICTQVLPDLLLFIFRLTDQNIDGLNHLVPAIRAQLEKHKEREVPILPVASVVLSQSSDELDARRNRAISLFQCRDNDLDYVRFDADLISEERLFCRREVMRSMWPSPPIVDDYERLSNAIRELNSLDTRTSSQSLDSQMASGDFASAEKTLSHLLRRRPDAARPWRHLPTLFLNMPERRRTRFADDLVDEILRESRDNAFALEWKASEVAANAETPDTGALNDARDLLVEALDCCRPRDELRLRRKLAEIASVRGELELATKELKECHALGNSNVQILLDLAQLYVRRGRDYFALATELFEGRQHDAAEQMLIYLWTFLGEEDKAETCFELCLEQSPRFSDFQFAQLVRSHQCLIRGEIAMANEIAMASLESKDDTPDETEFLNWAEFFLCAGDFERALKILNGLPPQLGKSLLTLVQYFNANVETTLEKTCAEWNDTEWSFTELFFFREREKGNKQCPYRDRLVVIEELIKKSELNSYSHWSEGTLFWRRFPHPQGDRSISSVSENLVK